VRLLPAGAVYFQLDEQDVRQILTDPHCMIGSDGLPHDQHPHPRLWGTFGRVLGHYSRDIGLFSLETAVHRMTGLTACEFGIQDRGIIAAGAYADLVVFDPDTIIDRATFDAPARPCAGIDRVLVNGAVVWQDGGRTNARPGRVLSPVANSPASHRVLSN
jgi:N-acyl-D-amino-acid deacylase